ncbi:MAG: hypothetical protein Ct9H300mP30_3010 [Methanobacteriota archaeon]|nr:MAG: hypothetical protein Ct9H300mP30_3010 [Euryarchaeota archaeon]
MLPIGEHGLRESRPRETCKFTPTGQFPPRFPDWLVVPVLGIYLFWLYCNKFLEMSIGYLSTMARDITIAGTQMNTSYYHGRLALLSGGSS